MADLHLTLACWDYDRTRALADGRVRPEGVELTYLPMEMPESFFRMLRFGDFEMSEMSLSWYTRTLFLEPRPFMAIPVFPSRMFRHSCIYVHTASGIRDPVDLIGRTVGCPEYGMTAVVWIKGILADRYSVPVGSVAYRTGGLEQPGRREMALDLPAGIEVKHIGDRRTLSEMLETGEIDALYSAHMPSCYAAGSPAVRRLFEDYATEEEAYLRDTGIFPIMHTVVIRSDVLDQNPWVAQSMTKAFDAAKAISVQDLYEPAASKCSLPWSLAEAERCRQLFGTKDFWPYGLEANRRTLEVFLRYSFDQGLCPRLVSAEDLFVPSTLETAKR
jgi:4,5-dihydroxyphthalate decarboxylase